MADLVLIRHGQTEWSAAGRHTSVTDLPLTPEGERQAERLGTALSGHRFAAVLCSPRQRAVRTAQLAGLSITAIDEDLAEWEYGRYEGRTTAEIRAQRPDWVLWRDGCPGGEAPEQVGSRLDRVLRRAAQGLAGGEVALVAHGHSLRVAGARWVGLPASAGQLLMLSTGALSVLGYEHDTQAIQSWNAPVPVDGAGQ